MSYLISQGVVQDSWGYSVDQDDHQNQNNQNSQQNQNNQNSQQMQSNAMFFELNMSLQPKSKFIEQKIKESNNIIYLQDFALSLGHSPEEDKQTLMIYVQNGAYFLYTIFKLLFEVNRVAFSKEFKYTVYPNQKQISSLVSMLQCLTNADFVKHRVQQYLTEDFSYEQNIYIFNYFEDLDIIDSLQNETNYYYKKVVSNLYLTDSNMVISEPEVTEFNTLWYLICEEEIDTTQKNKSNIECADLLVDKISEYCNCDYDYVCFIQKLFVVLLSSNHPNNQKLHMDYLLTFVFITANTVHSNKDKLKLLLTLLSSRQFNYYLNYIQSTSSKSV